MSHACKPILVGVASSVSEILLLSKTAKFPFIPVMTNARELTWTKAGNKFILHNKVTHSVLSMRTHTYYKLLNSIIHYTSLPSHYNTQTQLN